MANANKSIGPKESTAATPRTPKSIDKLTKQELIDMLQGRITYPLTPAQLYRCGASIIAKWCDDVVAGRYASPRSVVEKLEVLEKIYHQR